MLTYHKRRSCPKRTERGGPQALPRSRWPPVSNGPWRAATVGGLDMRTPPRAMPRSLSLCRAGSWSWAFWGPEGAVYSLCCCEWSLLRSVGLSAPALAVLPGLGWSVGGTPFLLRAVCRPRFTTNAHSPVQALGRLAAAVTLRYEPIHNAILVWRCAYPRTTTRRHACHLIAIWDALPKQRAHPKRDLGVPSAARHKVAKRR